ncbi:SDR family NAD(P)-dependent oxidoreductase, partial [Bordetella bronchiseptica]
MLLDNVIALVTGAAQGNGAAIARGLAAQGAAVAVCDIDLAGARRERPEADHDVRGAVQR